MAILLVCILKSKIRNFSFSKYWLIQNKVGTHWIQRLGAIYELLV